MPSASRIPPRGTAMDAANYRQMHLLDEVAKTPEITQRDLANRIGVALGLTNLMLRRLAKKGCIKIAGTKRSRLQYLITPKGLLEKTRLTYEYIQYSVQLYGDVRHFLRERLTALLRSGRPRILLCGSDELTEIAFLTIREAGLELAGVANVEAAPASFLGLAVRRMADVPAGSYDWVLVASLRVNTDIAGELARLGVPEERIIALPHPGALKKISPAEARHPGLDMAAREALPRALSPAETDVVVLCGGRGTRLGALTDATPKPLLPVANAPFLQHLLLQLHAEGFRRFLLAAQYLPEQFQAFAAAIAPALPDVEVIVEPEPLGTGGALRHAAQAVRSSVFVAVNGDSWVAQPIAPVLAEHQRRGLDCTVIAVPASQLEGGAVNKGIWRVGPEGRVLGFRTEAVVTDGWVNAGVYVLQHAWVRSWPTGSYSLEGNLESLLTRAEARVFCAPGRLVDIGTPECYAWANRVMATSENLTVALTSS